MKKYKKLFFENKNIPLSTIPFHSDVPFIERFFAEGFPMHLAIHKIDAAHPLEKQYTDPHVHDVNEINILIGDDNDPLVYMIQLGDEMYRVRSNMSVWIPAGLSHSTNVIGGSGYYIAIRLNSRPPGLNQIESIESRITALVEDVDLMIG